jgi:RNA polymerase sigma-70 factor (ECF subfamily)
VTNDTVDTASKGDSVYKGDISLVFATPRKVPIVAVYGDTGKPAPKVMVSTGGSQGGSGGSTDDAGQVVAKLPDGEYEVIIEPRIGTPYLNSKDKIVVSEASVKKPTQVVLRPAAVLDISVVDADTGKPLAGVDLWRQEPNADSTGGYRGEYGYYAWEVETNISHYDKHRTDQDGKMQVLFEPGKHRIGVGLNAHPDGYKPLDTDGKAVELQTGKPQAIQFQMRKQTQSSNRTPVKFQLVQNTAPVTEKTVAKRPTGILGYGDDKPDGKKSFGGSGQMIRFELPEGVTKIKGIRIHGSRYGLPQAPKEDFEITFLNEKRDETLHVEAAPYRLFNRGKEQWVRVAFKNEVELPRKFWVCLNFNAAQTKGVYVSYDTSTKGQYSRVGLAGDKNEPKETDFKGDWMVQVLASLPTTPAKSAAPAASPPASTTEPAAPSAPNRATTSSSTPSAP